MSILHETDIYYLKSVLRNVELLIYFVENEPHFNPGMGYEVLCDNRNWLTDHIAELEKENASSEEDTRSAGQETSGQVRDDGGEAGRI